MTNFDTVVTITENIKKALDAQGLKFSNTVYADERTIPASVLPLGRVVYTGELFDDVFGQKPGYAEAVFIVKATFSEREPDAALLKRQEWIQNIKSALTIEAINTGALAVTKLVSRVAVHKIDTESVDGLASLISRVTVRYRRM